MSGYDGGNSNSDYRGNGVTKYVLERIDALDDKIDGKLDDILGRLDKAERQLADHTGEHAKVREMLEKRKRTAIKIAAGIGSVGLTLLTAALAKGA